MLKLFIPVGCTKGEARSYVQPSWEYPIVKFLTILSKSPITRTYKISIPSATKVHVNLYPDMVQ